MDTKEFSAYLAFGTKRKFEDGDGRPAKATIGAPWEVYWVSYVVPEGIGFPPYYRVSDVIDGELRLEELVEGTSQFRKVNKWVGQVEHSKDHKRTAQRLVLKSKNPSCVIDKKTAMYLVQLNKEYEGIMSLPEEDAVIAVLRRYLALMDD